MSDAAFKKLYPFEGNYFDIDGLKYHYLDEGEKDAPVIIMLHGNPTWSFYYRNLVLGLRVGPLLVFIILFLFRFRPVCFSWCLSWSVGWPPV